MKPLRILLADDHAMMREGLKSILVHDLRMEVVGQAENGRKTIELVRSLKPDVVIMDINMPDLNGIEATRLIAGEFPDVRVIALSMHRDKHYVSEMLAAGASGYLLKHCAADELETAIRTVLNKKTYISPEVTGTIVDDYVSHIKGDKAVQANSLTPKEREILQLVAEGKSTKEIAGLLSVSVPTVETHRQHIMQKLDLHSIADLTKYAIRAGLTSLE